MPTKLIARSVGELEAINHVIHDCWFNSTDIDFDHDLATFTIPFEKVEFGTDALLQRTSAAYHRSFLRVMRVLSASIDDSEQVGSYDFNEVLFKPNRGVVLITTGVPIKIELRVTALEVMVEITDEILARKEGRRIMFDLFSKPRRTSE